MLSCTARQSMRRWRHSVPFRLHDFSANSRPFQQTAQCMSDMTLLHGSVAQRRQQSSARVRVARKTPTRPPKREPILASAAEAASAAHRNETKSYAELGRQELQPEKSEEEEEQQQMKKATEAKTTTLVSKWQAVRAKMSAEELKRLMRRYGPVALAFHTTVFLPTLGGFYCVVDYGFDVQSLVARVPIIAENMPNASAGNLAVAWGLTTVTGPVRGILTISLTPRIARLWWGREAKKKLAEIDAQEKERSEADEKNP